MERTFYPQSIVTRHNQSSTYLIRYQNIYYVIEW